MAKEAPLKNKGGISQIPSFIKHIAKLHIFFRFNKKNLLKNNKLIFEFLFCNSGN